jgi:hypothetical protein
MDRPKESIFGLVSGAYNTNKIRQLGGQFDSLHQDLNTVGNTVIAGTALALNEIKHLKTQSEKSFDSIAELQAATLAGMHQLYKQLDDLSKSHWELVNHFKDLAEKEERLGDLKIFLRNVKKEVERIREIAYQYPVYATYMAEELHIQFSKKDVRVEHFKSMSWEDMDYAENIINSVAKLYRTLYNDLG